jgi:cell division protein FtsZ
MEKMVNGMDMNAETETEIEISGPRIVVVGCGGAGCNSVHRLNRIGVHGAETVAINTDKLHLDKIDAHRKLLIGRRITRGRGAGGLPEVGERCAEQSKEDIAEVLGQADMTFVVAGMGGGTGTGAAPHVSRVAKDSGSIVIGMAVAPFKAEMARHKTAKHGLEKFRKHADSVVVLENDRLLKFVPELPFEQALGVMDHLISEVIKGITEAITMPSLINLDFADIRTVMKGGGASTLLYGENSALDPDAVIAQTLEHPFLDIDYSHAKSALIHLTTGPSLPIQKMHDVVYGITSELNENANVIFGVRNDDHEFNDVIRVLTVVTGAKSQHLLYDDSKVVPNPELLAGQIRVIE